MAHLTMVQFVGVYTGYMIPGGRGYHFRPSFVVGPGKPKRAGRGDIAVNHVLIGSQIFCQKVRATHKERCCYDFFVVDELRSPNFLSLVADDSIWWELDQAVGNIKLYLEMSWQMLVHRCTSTVKQCGEK